MFCVNPSWHSVTLYKIFNRLKPSVVIGRVGGWHTMRHSHTMSAPKTMVMGNMRARDVSLCRQNAPFARQSLTSYPQPRTRARRGPPSVLLIIIKNILELYLSTLTSCSTLCDHFVRWSLGPSRRLISSYKPYGDTWTRNPG